VIVDYLIFTKFISRPGWLIFLLLFTFISMINKNLFNKKGLKSLRSSLRNRSTSAEAALWNILKSRNFDDKKFRRQYSIGNFIVDFCCPSEKLMIELDGDPLKSYTFIMCELHIFLGNIFIVLHILLAVSQHEFTTICSVGQINTNYN